MRGPLYQIRQCQVAACGLRFPVTENDRTGDLCPRCGGATLIVFAGEPASNRSCFGSDLGELPLYALLDNIRSVFNVGSIFRTADGAGINHLHLCGITPTPRHPKLEKTALGAEQTVPWSQHNNGVETALELKALGLKLWALEGGERAESLFSPSFSTWRCPAVVVVGNELTGVDPGIVELCDRVFCIPMRGMKRSLNVAIAFSIAVYWLRAAQALV